jgi:hypothetical protein
MFCLCLSCFMWNVLVLLLMHLLGAADSVVASYVFVII